MIPLHSTEQEDFNASFNIVIVNFMLQPKSVSRVPYVRPQGAYNLLI